MATQIRTTDTNRHNEFADAVDRAFVDIGDRFGLYQTIAETGPATVGQLSRNSGIPAYHLAPWLQRQAAASFLTFDSKTGRYSSWCDLPGPGI